MLPPATTSVKLGRLDLVQITLQVAEPSKVTGTDQGQRPGLDDRREAELPGADHQGHRAAGLVNLVKPGCGTARTTATLSGTVDFTQGRRSRAGRPTTR